MDTWAYLCFAAVTGCLVLSWICERKRSKGLRALARRLRFIYIGNALPRSLTLHATGLEGASSVWNVIDGLCGATRVIAFDYRIGSGKGSRRRTAIAAQGPRDIFLVAKFNSDLTFDRSGEWTIMYEPHTFSLVPRGLMPTAELEAQLGAIGPFSPSLQAGP